MSPRKRKRRGSDGYRDGSDGYRSGSDGYRSGSDGYPPNTGPGQPEAGSDQAARGADPLERASEPSEGWWTGYGFASLGDYLREVDAGWERIGWSRKRAKRSEVPVPDPPGVSASVPAPQRLREQRGRQVGVRLDASGYRALCEAARIYGVAPSTMARLLVHKGAVKIVSDQAESEADSG